MILRLTALGCVLAALLLSEGQTKTCLPAFPGAEGAGACASGGRGGSVYVVTNLNADGPGSLADAVSRPNRIVIFAVSGTIDLTRKKGKHSGSIQIAQPNITVEGQSAPGEGICIRGGSIQVAAGNVILRYLRVRRGFVASGNSGDAIDIKGQFSNVIVDHVSTSWATDENLTLTNANNVTAQYSIAAEGLDYYNPEQSPFRHSEGSLFGSQTPGGHMTIHHTIYAHNRLRSPRTTGHSGPGAPPVLDFHNNVVYDGKEYTSHTGSQAVYLNWTNNYYKDGPSTGIEGAEVKQVIFTFMKAPESRMYLNGNYVYGSPERTANNWRAVVYHSEGQNEKIMRVDKPFDGPPVTKQSAVEAFETVLANAGATLPGRDAVDARIVRDIREGTGAVINFETDIREPGRWQTYHSLPAPADSDGDGIPDYWEEQFGLRKNSADDATHDPDGDGYTNIEEFLNNTDPRGGTTPIVYVSAIGSRAYRQDGKPGEIRFTRTGDTGQALEVRYTLSGAERRITMPRGAASAAIAVPAGTEDVVVARIAADPAYHIGCPMQALVAVENSASPIPVKLADLDPEGAPTEAARKRGEEQMKEHKVWKAEKLKARGDK